MGTCALRGGRSATNATNPGAAAASSTQRAAGEGMPGAGPGVDGSVCLLTPGQCLFLSILLVLLTNFRKAICDHNYFLLFQLLKIVHFSTFEFVIGDGILKFTSQNLIFCILY